MDVMHGPLVYLVIIGAAAIEGEVAYVAASALVAQGVLNPLAVIAAGTMGAAIGDQFYFYLLRGRLARWLARFPKVARRAEPLVGRVRRHQAAMVLLIRFAPGLRIALAAACAYVGVSAVRFSVLNLVAAFLWAITLFVLIAWAGPAYLSAIGLTGWKAAVVTGLVVVIVLHLAGRAERRAMATPR
jgi:membrane protein DedA with SNARE-associated domain